MNPNGPDARDAARLAAAWRFIYLAAPIIGGIGLAVLFGVMLCALHSLGEG